MHGSGIRRRSRAREVRPASAPLTRARHAVPPTPLANASVISAECGLRVSKHLTTRFGASARKQIPGCVPRPSRSRGTGKKKRGAWFGMTREIYCLMRITSSWFAANEQKYFFVDHFFGMRRSRPDISGGSGTSRTPRSVGAISRSEPPGVNWVRPFSVSRMKGTGLVV